MKSPSNWRFEVGKFYKTRAGEKVECVAVWSKPAANKAQVTCLDECGEEQFHALDGLWYLGREVYERPHDVVGPADQKVWFWCYADGGISEPFFSEEAAVEKIPSDDAVLKVIEWNYDECR